MHIGTSRSVSSASAAAGPPKQQHFYFVLDPRDFRNRRKDPPRTASRTQPDGTKSTRTPTAWETCNTTIHRRTPSPRAATPPQAPLRFGPQREALSHRRAPSPQGRHHDTAPATSSLVPPTSKLLVSPAARTRPEYSTPEREETDDFSLEPHGISGAYRHSWPLKSVPVAGSPHAPPNAHHPATTSDSVVRRRTSPSPDLSVALDMHHNTEETFQPQVNRRSETMDAAAQKRRRLLLEEAGVFFETEMVVGASSRSSSAQRRVSPPPVGTSAVQPRSAAHLSRSTSVQHDKTGDVDEAASPPPRWLVLHRMAEVLQAKKQSAVEDHLAQEALDLEREVAAMKHEQRLLSSRRHRSNSTSSAPVLQRKNEKRAGGAAAHALPPPHLPIEEGEEPSCRMAKDTRPIDDRSPSPSEEGESHLPVAAAESATRDPSENGEGRTTCDADMTDANVVQDGVPQSAEYTNAEKEDTNAKPHHVSDSDRCPEPPIEEEVLLLSEGGDAEVPPQAEAHPPPMPSPSSHLNQNQSSVYNPRASTPTSPVSAPTFGAEADVFLTVNEHQGSPVERGSPSGQQLAAAVDASTRQHIESIMLEDHHDAVLPHVVDDREPTPRDSQLLTNENSTPPEAYLETAVRAHDDSGHSRQGGSHDCTAVERPVTPSRSSNSVEAIGCEQEEVVSVEPGAALNVPPIVDIPLVVPSVPQEEVTRICMIEDDEEVVEPEPFAEQQITAAPVEDEPAMLNESMRQYNDAEEEACMLIPSSAAVICNAEGPEVKEETCLRDPHGPEGSPRSMMEAILREGEAVLEAYERGGAPLSPPLYADDASSQHSLPRTLEDDITQIPSVLREKQQQQPGTYDALLGRKTSRPPSTRSCGIPEDNFDDGDDDVVYAVHNGTAGSSRCSSAAALPMVPGAPFHNVLPSANHLPSSSPSPPTIRSTSGVDMLDLGASKPPAAAPNPSRTRWHQERHDRTDSWNFSLHSDASGYVCPPHAGFDDTTVYSAQFVGTPSDNAAFLHSRAQSMDHDELMTAFGGAGRCGGGLK